MVQFEDTILEKIAAEPPIMGLAISGGGYRSMLTSTGFIKEMKKFGLFDCLSYISGLSGGSWVLMDLVINDFNVNQMLNNWSLDDGLLEGIPDFDFEQEDLVSGMDEDTIKDLRELNERGLSELDSILQEDLQISQKTVSRDRIVDDNSQICKREYNPLTKLRELLFPSEVDGIFIEDTSSSPSSLTNLQRILKFYINLHLAVRPKRFKGFRVSFTDYLGKAFIKQLKKKALLQMNTTSFSQLVNQSSSFLNHTAPFPIFVANCKNKSLKNIIFEFTPFEFGSWEPIVKLFVKVKFLGSKIREGHVLECFNGFDDIGFITATSSSIFNNVLIYIWQLTAGSSRETIKAVKSILSIFGLKSIRFHTEEKSKSFMSGQLNTDYAVVHPNPFYKYQGRETPMTTDDFLYLVDGGEDGENIPLRPLIIPERKVDLIFVIDSSSDVHNYATGTKLRNILNQIPNGQQYLASGDVLPLPQPIALGCYKENSPIIIYQANSEHSYPSNTSTFKITYNESEVSGMLQNGRDIFSADGDSYYRNCLSCLILKRTFDKMHDPAMPDFCSECFEHYCF